MSEIKSKSEQNLEMARLSIEKMCYATSVHCSYYSCVQFMTHLLLTHFEMSEQDINREQKEVSNELGGGFHAWLINFFFTQLLPFERGKVALEFNEYIPQLKNARVLADYKNKKIIKKKAEESYSYSMKILHILETSFK